MDKNFILQSDLAAAELVYPLSCWVIQDGDVVDEANIVFSLDNRADRMQTVEALGERKGINIRATRYGDGTKANVHFGYWRTVRAGLAFGKEYTSYTEAVRHAVMDENDE